VFISLAAGATHTPAPSRRAGTSSYQDTGRSPGSFFFFWVWSWGWNGFSVSHSMALALTYP